MPQLSLAQLSLAQLSLAQQPVAQLPVAQLQDLRADVEVAVEAMEVDEDANVGANECIVHVQWVLFAEPHANWDPTPPARGILEAQPGASGEWQPIAVELSCEEVSAGACIAMQGTRW
ncbi:MAG: hypothetical protein ACK4YO_03655, partial [Candidatus Altarchaeaceae archaeon]